MPRPRLLPRLAAVVLVLLGALVWMSPVTAFASCAGDPAKSPAAFTGVVTATSYQDRVATVRTVDGVTVTVVGTPATGPGAGTSVDRTYEVGGRYEFHPINAEPPYQDNICTATRLLSRDRAPAASTSHGHDSPSAGSSSDASAHGALAGLAQGVAVAVTAAAAIGAVLWRRSKRVGG